MNPSLSTDTIAKTTDKNEKLLSPLEGKIACDQKTLLSLYVKNINKIDRPLETPFDIRVHTLELSDGLPQNVQVVAKNASIQGVTHPNSRVEADTLCIETHQGFAQGKTIHVQTLDGGAIVGEHVVIGALLKGSVHAKTISIQTLGQDSSIKAVESINIQEIIGTNNSLHLEFARHNYLTQLHEYGSSYKREMELILMEIHFQEEYRAQYLEEEKKLRKILKEHQRAHHALPQLIVQRMFELETKLLQSKRLLAKSKHQKKVLHKECEKVFSSIITWDTTAKITSKGPWKASNRIIFDLPCEEELLTFTTTGDELAGEFRITKNDANAYMISYF